MKKNLFVTLCISLLLCAAGTSHALQVQWNVATAGAPGFGDPNSLTGFFNQIGFDSQTSSIQYNTDGSTDPGTGLPTLTVGDEFDDAGNLKVNGLIATSGIDEEGLNVVPFDDGTGSPTGGGYEVTAVWNDIEGYVNSVGPAPTGTSDTQIGLTYTQGTVDFYLDWTYVNLGDVGDPVPDGFDTFTFDSEFANPAGTDPPAGAGGTGFDTGTNSVLIASLSLIEGLGTTFIDFNGGPLENQGSVDLFMEFTYLLDGFWLTYDYGDLADLPIVSWVLLTTDMNIDTPTQDPGVPAGALYTAYSNQNGSATLTVVPEPSTFFLLGFGLLGLGFLARKRSRN